MVCFSFLHSAIVFLVERNHAFVVGHCSALLVDRCVCFRSSGIVDCPAESHCPLFCLMWRWWWIRRVSGNPVCQAGNIARPALCDKAFAGKQAWTSPYSPTTNCPSLTCSDNRVINPFLPGNCNCTQPLEIQLEARRPAFSAITDEFMETLRGQLAQQLNLRMTQVWITTAAFTADGRAEINVDFFNADGVSPLDGAATLNVTHSLTSNYLALPSVKPYLARVLVDGATFCKPGSLPFKPKNFLLSSGTSRNGT